LIPIKEMPITKGLLRYLYWEKRFSMHKMAKILDCSVGNIFNLMKKFEIPSRTSGEAQKGMKKWGGHRKCPWISKSNKKRWKNPEYRKKIIKNLTNHIVIGRNTPQFQRKLRKALCKKPTQPERFFINIIERNDFPIKYVGDGEKIIGTLNPDFIHKTEKKVIEIFGRVYHDPEASFKRSVPWHQQYFGRMAYYAQFGYDCLILWDDELSDEEAVVSKIESFMAGG